MAENLLFSIVIPTYNRPDRLRTCLEAIAKIEYSRENFEVIVVDDGSEMPLDPIVAPFKPDLDLKLLRQENAGPASARNAGAAIATGKFIVFTDDDCLPTANWLSILATQFASNAQALIGGQTINALSENVYSTASQLLIDYLYEYYNHGKATVNFFASNNFALPVEKFRSIAGFDTNFPLAAGEDREFCDRWLDRGGKLVYAPQAQVYHAHQLTLLTFWRQHFNYGRGAFCFHQARAQRKRSPIAVEPLSFYFKLLTYPLLKVSLPQAIYLSVLMFLSQIANVLGFFYERRAAGPQVSNLT
ncbi:glycosyltransferase family 2 protein [Chamaesiphon minutus]|uniref:Putative glycosyltransferase n=1 Tax=Chamaesiphon minutus (strain ATCC 27169 / PCC 6605) TaxID=1173020 RepID=K9UQ48_CHAP6|nr:glycosyltransferase [Chamaesiphon minutus]AFY96576.1 putative glycosyltransferase [Chamaesiphon minutus PCC 6605]